jgi:hypothetical protein
VTAGAVELINLYHCATWRSQAQLALAHSHVSVVGERDLRVMGCHEKWRSKPAPVLGEAVTQLVAIF